MVGKTIDTIKALRSEATNFAGFHELFSVKYASDSHCDKKGYGFERKTDRFVSFSLEVSFCTHAGYYGNSSCSTIMHVRDDDLVRPYLIKALNVHQKEIFATVARLMRDEAATLTDKAQAEVEAIQQLLELAKSDLAETSEAAWAKLAERLGREPTREEAKAEVNRILREAREAA